ncbi:MAG: hypothetical protein ACLFTK_08285 [Anaerolineales bacterium]
MRRLLLIMMLCFSWPVGLRAQTDLSPEQEALLTETTQALRMAQGWQQYRFSDQFETDYAQVTNQSGAALWEVSQLRRERNVSLNRAAEAAQGTILLETLMDGADEPTQQTSETAHFIYVDDQLILGDQALREIALEDAAPGLGVADVLDFSATEPTLLTLDLLATAQAVFDLGVQVRENEQTLQGYEFAFDPAAALTELAFDVDNLVAELDITIDHTRLVTAIQDALAVQGTLWVDQATNQPIEMTLVIDFQVELALSEDEASGDTLSLVYAQTWQARYFNIDDDLQIELPAEDESEASP